MKDDLIFAMTKFSAQLGEIAWHSINTDTGFHAVGEEHTKFIAKLLADHGLLSLGRPARFLEVAPYLHTTAQALNRDFGVEGAACDISMHTLSAGDADFRKTNIKGHATLLAADFHNLPFSTDYFDVVFIASAVHHTLRPDRVISELLRVARPGGYVVLYNEPVGSEGCFYSFRSNRRDSFSPWELELSNEGLMRIVSSPFPGSRPEQLFGMVENDRISLDTYLNSNGELIDLDLRPHPGALDLEFARHRSDADAIAAELHKRLLRLKGLMGRSEELMGFCLPNTQAVNEWSHRYATSLRAIELAQETENEKAGESVGTSVRISASLLAQSRLYGATLRMTLRKPGTGIASASMLGNLEEGNEGDLVTHRSQAERIRIRTSQQTVPVIGPEQSKELLRYFPAAQWSLIGHAQPYTMCLSGKSGAVHIGGSGQWRILLLRYYAVANAQGPYWIDISADETLIDSSAICQSESRLLKLLLPLGCNKISFNLREDGQIPMSFSWAVRIAYLDVIACEKIVLENVLA